MSNSRINNRSTHFLLFYLYILHLRLVHNEYLVNFYNFSRKKKKFFCCHFLRLLLPVIHFFFSSLHGRSILFTFSFVCIYFRLPVMHCFSSDCMSTCGEVLNIVLCFRSECHKIEVVCDGFNYSFCWLTTLASTVYWRQRFCSRREDRLSEVSVSAFACPVIRLFFFFVFVFHHAGINFMMASVYVFFPILFFSFIIMFPIITKVFRHICPL